MNTPKISPRTRTRLYVAALAVHVLAFLALSILPVWDVLPAEPAARTLGYIVAGVGTVTSALAVGYRPTRPSTPPDDR